MTFDEVAQVIDSVGNGVLKGLRETRHIPMMAIAFNGKKPMMIDLEAGIAMAESMHEAGKPDAAHRVKDAMSTFLRSVLRNIQADGVILIHDAWITGPKTGKIVGGDDPSKGYLEIQAPREDPTRQEALLLTWEFKTSDKGLIKGIRHWIYHHTPGGIEVEPAIEFTGESEGRFTNLLS